MSDSTVNLIVFISFAIILIVVILIKLAVRSSRKKKAELLQQGLVGAGAKGRSMLNDQEYNYEHFQGGKNAPPYLKIVIPCPSYGSFKVRKESGFDRFFKRIGLTVKFETGDYEFDSSFYTSSNNLRFTHQFLDSPETRKSIKTIFEKGFTEITLEKNYLVAKWAQFPRNGTMAISEIESTVENLGVLKKTISYIPSMDDGLNPAWKVKRFAAFAIPILIIITGIAAVISGLTTYKPLDQGKMFLDSFKFSIGAFILYIIIAVMLLKGRPSSHVELIAAFAISLGGFILAGMGYEMFLNGYLDKSPSSTHIVQVLDKHINKGKSKSYHVVVQSWRPNEVSEQISVSRGTYDEIEPGVTRFIFTTKPGKYGFEWIEKYILFSDLEKTPD